MLTIDMPTNMYDILLILPDVGSIHIVDTAQSEPGETRACEVVVLLLPVECPRRVPPSSSGEPQS